MDVSRAEADRRASLVAAESRASLMFAAIGKLVRPGRRPDHSDMRASPRNRTPDATMHKRDFRARCHFTAPAIRPRMKYFWKAM